MMARPPLRLHLLTVRKKESPNEPPCLGPAGQYLAHFSGEGPEMLWRQFDGAANAVTLLAINIAG